MNEDYLLQVANVTVSYDVRRSMRPNDAAEDASAFVLRDFSASFRRGQVHWILGPNGAGKSTLFRAVAGELTPAMGSITFNGHSILRLTSAQRIGLGIGRFLQSEWVFPNLSILDNLLVGARNLTGEHPLGALLPAGRRAERHFRDLALGRLEEFGFTSRFDVHATKAGTLSCGWAKLLSLVRLLIQDPSLWLLDEPVANVDEHNQERICTLIRREAEERGRTILLIEHEVGRQGRVSEIANRALLLFQGKVVNDGEPKAVKASQVYRDVFGAA